MGRRKSSTALRVFDTGVLHTSHVGDHRVVVADPDPAISMIAFGDEGRLWSVEVQVARHTLGPRRGSPIYDPSVLLIRVRNTKGTFPLEELKRVIPFDADNTTFASGYNHLHDSDAIRIRLSWQGVRHFLWNLGKTLKEATVRVGRGEIFVEDGKWIDDMSQELSALPATRF